MSDHDMVPFPQRGTFAEVRMIYCQRCGATQVVEASADHAPLPPCPLAARPPEVDAGPFHYAGQHDDCIALTPHLHDRPYRLGDWSASRVPGDPTDRPNQAYPEVDAEGEGEPRDG